MIVLVSDYKDQMLNGYEKTEQAVKEAYETYREKQGEHEEELSVCIEPYDTPAFWEILKKADGLICAFLPVDDLFLEKAPHLKMISVNATGYSTVNLNALKKHGVCMSHIVSYCEREVAEHAITMMLALNKNLGEYAYEILHKMKWRYMDLQPRRTVDHLTLTIFGLGRIGKTTARLANALGMRVQAVDPYLDEETAKACKTKPVSLPEALESSDVIINHMILNDTTRHFFNRDFFDGLKKKPIFINVGRGESVEEEALAEALKEGRICAAGLDVLKQEDPDLTTCPFVHMPNVILTPHSAFYSQDSERALEEISGRNMGLFLAGRTQEIQGFIDGRKTEGMR